MRRVTTVGYDKTSLSHAQAENHPTKETLASLQQKHDSAMAAVEARHEVRCTCEFMRCALTLVRQKVWSA